MKGYRVHEFGDTDAMVWEDLGELAPQAGQVLVRVHASGINFAETRMRRGTYSGQELPFVMGMESAGEVLEVGAGVKAFSVGDRVFGRARGSHAEAVLFDAEHLMPLPERLDFAAGAAIPVGWLTAWHALVTVAGTRPGQRVLIEAVASSVGSAALQIAQWQGAWVAGTASRDPKLQRAKASGADAIYNYKTEDLRHRVGEDTGGAGIDIGLMTIGEETAQALFDCMGQEGQVIMYGSTGGKKVAFDLNIGTRNLQLKSMSISTSPQFVPDSMRTFRDQALPLFAAGAFKPVVDTVLPMAELAKAHGMVNDRDHYGKIIMTNDPI
jgi:NADPH2:quinone reductase